MDEADWSDLMAWDTFDPVYELALIDEATLAELEVECEQEA